MKCFKQYLLESKTFSHKDAKRLGDSLSVDWSSVDIEQFKMGLGVETEHDTGDNLDVVNSNIDLAKIVLAHLRDTPDYYTKLKAVEEDAPANSVGFNHVAGLNEPLKNINKNTILRRTRRK